MVIVELALGGVGRPRDSALDTRIRSAALEVLRARGPDGVTVEAVAELAGCGKTSIYRRYRNSADMLAAALAGLAHSPRSKDVDLTWRQELVAALEQFRVGVEQQVGLRGVASMLYDPGSEFSELMRHRLLKPRLRVVADLLCSAADTGEVRRSDAEALVFGLAGSYFARLVVTGHVGPSWAQETVDELTRCWP